MTLAAESQTEQTGIVLTRVSQVFGGFAALRDVSFRLPRGASVVLLGGNGAGKSTLLRLLAGLAQPRRGEIRVFGLPPQHRRGRIGYMSHATMLYDELTGAENLLYFARLTAPLPDAEQAHRVNEALRSVGLDPLSRRPVGEYSQGMRQRASLARVLLNEPELLLLDEPFSNLDAGSAQAMIARLQAFLAEPGEDGQPRTLLLTTHQAELAKPLARMTLVLKAGRLLQPIEGESGAHSRSHETAKLPVVLDA